MASRVSLIQSRSIYVGTLNSVAPSDGNLIVTGNVGIGTTAPGVKLDVNGAIRATAGDSSGLRVHTNSGITASNNYMNFFTSQSNGWSFNTNGTGADSDSKVVITAAGNVGIGTASPSKKLHISGAGTAGILIDNTAYNSDLLRFRTTHYSPGFEYKFWMESDGLKLSYAEDPSYAHIVHYNFFKNGNFTVNAGNVGIGTTSPAYKLSVNESTTNPIAYFGLGPSNASSRNSLIILQSGTIPQNGSDTTGEVGFLFKHSYGTGGVNGTANGGYIESIRESVFGITSQVNTALVFGTSAANTDAERLRITSGGNVGIGTTAPGEKLEVNGNIKLSSTANSTATPSYIWLGNDYSNGTTRDKLKIYLYNSGTEKYGFSVGATGDVQYHSNVFHDFYVNNGNVMRINSAGNVGIGTTSPGAKLDVNGEVRSDKSANGISFSSTGGGLAFTAFDVYTATNGGLIRLYNESTQTVNIDGRSAGGNTYFNNGGNVGIGTTSPSSKLDVAGDIRATQLLIGESFKNGYNSYTQGAMGQFVIQSGLGGLGEGGTADHLLFRAPDLYEAATTSGGAYSDVTSTYSSTYKNLFMGLKDNVSITNQSVYSIRMTWDSIGYRFFDTLYMPCNLQGNSIDIIIEKYDGTTWTIVATRNGFTGWEGRNVYINSWNNSGHSDKLRITFNINWNNSNTAYIYRIAYYGGYPAGAENKLFTWDYDKKINIYGDLKMNGGTFLTDDGVSHYVMSQSNLYLYSGSSHTMTLSNAGNVGIGTTSPLAILDVYQAGQPQLRVRGTAGANHLYQDSTTGTTINDGLFVGIGGDQTGYIYHYEANPLVFATSNAERMRITAVGNVGIGTTAPNEKLHVAGNIHAYAPSGIDAGLFSSTAAGSTTIAIRSLGITHFNGGNVGIGTTNPNAKLEIETNDLVTRAIFVKGIDSEIYAPTNNGGYGVFSITSDVGSTRSSKFFVNAAGNVGIGTTAPDQLLHINAGASAAYIHLVGQSRNLYIGQDSSGAIMYSDGDAPMIFTTNASERMRITSAGNVGIGTTSPGAKLEIVGASGGLSLKLPSGQWYGASSTNRMAFDNPNQLFHTGGASGAYKFRNSGDTDDVFTILNTGNVGIGTTAPESKLHVAGGQLTLKGGTPTDQQIVFNFAREYVNGIYNSSGHFRLQDNSLGGTVYQWDGSSFCFPNGNVGIGTTSPGAKLDVRGRTNVWGGGTTSATLGFSVLDSPGSNYNFYVEDDGGAYLRGNVRIGNSTNNGYKLDVSGTAYVSDDLLVGATNAASWHRISVAVGGFIAQNGNKGLGAYSDSTSTELFAYNYDTPEYVPMQIRSSTLSINNASNSSVIYHDGTNVGIGTTGPSYKLQISDTAANGRAIQAVQTATSGTNYGGVIAAEGTGATQNVGLYVNAIGATTNYAAIFANGNVGIGTTSPSTLLNVMTATNAVDVLRLDNSGGNSGSVQGVTHLAINHFGTGTNPSTRITAYQDGVSGWPGGMYFSTRSLNTDSAPVERMRITSDGNVGIGTTSPQYPLVVNGDAQINAAGTGPAYAYQPDGGFGVDSLVTSSVENVALGKPDVWLRIHVDGVAFVFPGYQEP